MARLLHLRIQNKVFIIFLCLICGSNVGILTAQNLESIGKEDPVKINGGVSLNQIFYTASGIDSRRDPYSYFATGNLNVSLYGWSIPLSFSLSNQNVTFQQPFNQFTLHPTYKWATLHLGFTSMSFSQYTLSGHLFRGVGADLNPTSKLRISAMYGRLLKAVEPDTVSENAVLPSFDRFGYGLKVGYGDNKNFIETIVFRAYDDSTSISYIPEEQGILPQENLVVALAGGKTLFDRVMLRAEWATSAITRDTRAEEASTNNLLGKLGGLFTPRGSSSYYNAYKANLTYAGEGYSVGMGYERIDPQYRTLGAYFFNNDLENITVNAATALFQGKVNVAANVGTQRDNLDNSKISTMRRVVAAANVAVAPSPKLNVSVSYSSFQTFTNIRSQFVDINQLTPFDNLDTLNFTQISQNASVNAMYMLGNNKSRRQMLNLNLTVQDAADNQGGANQNSGLQFYNFNTSYSLSLTPQNLTLSTTFNLSLSDGAALDSRTLGPTVALSKQFFEKKLRTTLSVSQNESYANGVHTGSILNGRLSGMMSIKKKHNINLGIVLVNRNTKQEQGPKAFTELTGTLGYAYSF